MGENADKLYEAVLVLRCQTGDEAAFAELVGRYHRRLRYYLRKMLADAHRADDALQDVWLEVFRGLPRLRDSDALAAWMYRIARRRAVRLLRQRQRVTDVEREAVASEVLDPVLDPDQAFSREDAAAIHAALDVLTPEHREMLILRFVEGMSYEEVAAVTGLALGTVRSRLHYAKRALRLQLERTDAHEGDGIGSGTVGR
jgi:RNA polymerase sigma-70 factor (ECF subfamily)